MDKYQFKPIEIFTSLDLELNQRETGAKIIEIGAVTGNIKTGEILDTLSVFINPQEELTPMILQLTGIKQSDVDSGVTLEQGYRLLENMHKRHSAFVNPVTWGGGDSQELLAQLKAENPQFQGWCFGRRWIDSKTLFVSWRIAQGLPIKGGLKNSCAKLGVRFHGPAHRAERDAYNTFFAYKKLLEIINQPLLK